MGILVTFYSRTGNTKKVAEEIAKELRADIDEIKDIKNREGIVGFIGAGRDAVFKKQTRIKNNLNPDDYGLIIIGTPIWAGTMVPAIRSYLVKNNLKNKKVAFFCTAGNEQKKAFFEMEKLSSKPIALVGIRDKKVKNNKFQEEVKCFCGKVKNNYKY